MAFASSSQTLSLPELADRISLAHKLATSTLRNLVDSESDWNPDAAGDFRQKIGDYCSWGLVQINVCAHSSPKDEMYATKEQALDPAFALNFAADAIAAGTEDNWTSCNCYSLVWTRLKGLPLMQSIVPNSEPKVGAVAVFMYRSKGSGEPVKHIAYVEKVVPGGVVISEANFSHCLIDSRTIHFYDPALLGFWSPRGV